MTTYKYHPCLDVNEQGTLELKIFNCMFHEIELPKFKNAVEKMGKDNYNDQISITDAMVLHYQSSGSNENVKRLYGKYISNTQDFFQRKFTLKEKLLNLFRKEDTPDKTFSLAKTLQEEINPNVEEETLKKFDKLLQRAKQTNQISLYEILEKHKNIFLNEIVLAKNGFTKYVTEDQAVVFMKNSAKGVRIDFLRGYTRSIPINVSKLKEKADALNVFDNYVVMHYDPSLKVLTEQSKSRNVKEAVTKYKDPILFGIIFGSRRLYYVADWITDDDDLTLDKLMSEIDGPLSRQKELQEAIEDAIVTIENIDITSLNE